MPAIVYATPTWIVRQKTKPSPKKGRPDSTGITESSPDFQLALGHPQMS